MKIAIIGSGISGLAACHFLSEAGHRVSIFEKSDRLGFDQFWTEIPEVDQNGQTLRCDVPPRMFQPNYWPNLSKLYQKVGIQFNEAESGRSYSTANQNPFLRLHQNLTPKMEWSLLGSESREILAEVQTLKEKATEFLNTSSNDSVSMKQFLTDGGFGENLIYKFLYPSLSSTVCTCDFDSLDHYPAKVLLQGMLSLQSNSQLFRSARGSGDVAAKLSAKANEIHLNEAIVEVNKTGTGMEVKRSSGQREPFDHVVLATEPATAMELTSRENPILKEHLTKFPFQRVPVVVHCDSSFMPPNKKSWEAFNMITDRSNKRSMCSIWLNKFYGWTWLKKDYFQTIMPLEQPEDDKVIRASVMNRAVVNEQTIEASSKIEQHQRNQKENVWYCGSYLTDQIPLLESGVQSAKMVCDWIDERAKTKGRKETAASLEL